MMPVRLRLPLLFGLLVLAGALPAAAATAYKGAIVIDADTGRPLIEDDADIVSPPASVTKLMTFLVVHDRLAAGTLSLQTPVTVTAEAANTGGSQVYLAEREVFSVEELLYALMINSANDAATALALHVGGSRAAFVELMNARARELGMTRTTFRSPHGLPPASRRIADGDLTSPRDLALLSAHLLTRTDILKYTSVRDRVFRPGPRRIDMRNHNHLLGKVAGVDGLKTGYTRGAGYCLAATALRDGRRVIVVVMGSPESQTRDLAVTDLIERGFAALPATAVITVPGEMPPPSAPAPAPRPAAADAPAIKPAPALEEPPAVRFVLPGRR